MYAARALLLAAALGLAACSRPQPPTVKPLSARVTSISPTGLSLAAKMEANNPNSVDLEIKSLTATITLEGKYRAGTVNVSHTITLPAHRKTTFELPLSMQWANLLEIAPLALHGRDVPYEVKGTVKAGADGIDADLPITLTGTITHQQIQEAVGSAVPKGLPLPF